MDLLTVKLSNGFMFTPEDGNKYKYVRVDKDNLIYMLYFNNLDDWFKRQSDVDILHINKYIDSGIFEIVTDPVFISESPVYNQGCNHEYINVGFTSITMACKHCGKDK